jgi:DNA-binding FrmR family transcriptional regulator
VRSGVCADCSRNSVLDLFRVSDLSGLPPLARVLHHPEIPLVFQVCGLAWRGREMRGPAKPEVENGHRLAKDRGLPYLTLMSHTVKNKAKLLGRVRRIRGQVEAIERALEAEIGCADVLMLVASVRGAINGLTAELMEDHIRNHVVDPAHEPDPERAKGAAELIDVVRTYLK